MEKRIFEDFIAEEKIDPEEIVKALAKQEEDRSNKDMEAGASLVKEGRL